MTKITAELVKELREVSGAGMMDCKKALTECNGDKEAAIDWLRKKGLATAAKKADRVAAEGLVCVAVEGNVGVILEVNSETDFVSRNEMFQNFVKDIAKLSLKSDGTLEGLKKTVHKNGKTVEQELVELIANIGENLSLRRVVKVNAKGKLHHYIHNTIADGLGKIGVLVDYESSNNEIGKHIALHIAASSPKSLSKEDLDVALVERERKLQKEMAEQSGKPAEIVNKMIEGRISKFYQEVCLLEQPFVMDPDKKVSKILEESSAKINKYVYFILGEGIEKEQVNFAEEVAKAAK